jgi:hypothetical protein
VPGQFAKNAELFSRFTIESTGANIFLGCLEDLVAVVAPDLLARTPMILQACYDADILDGDMITKWYDAPPESSWLVSKDAAQAVRDKAKVFVDWLKLDDDDEGDESESSDDDDDDESKEE